MNRETHGHTRPAGALGLSVMRAGSETFEPVPVFPPIDAVEFTADRPAKPKVRQILRYGLPSKAATDEVNEWRTRNLPNLWRGARQVLAARGLRLPHLYGALYLRLLRGNGELVDYGLASLRVVTDAGMGFVVDAFQNLVELENMKFHGFGTGGTAESAAQTALVTEETTQYNPDNTRPTGTTAEASAQVYQTVATYSPDSGGTRAITEHAVFSQAATGGGVMIDRSLFSVVNVVAAADSLQATYQLTFASGG